MCISGEYLKKRKFRSPELLQINWDRLVFRSFLVLVALLIVGFTAYVLWAYSKF